MNHGKNIYICVMTRKNLRIPAIDKSLNKTLTIAAKNKGQTRSAFLRPQIRAIVESFPDELKTERKIETGELQISGIPDDVLTDLKTIAKNMGVCETQLLRIKLFEISNNLPDWLKVNPDSLD